MDLRSPYVISIADLPRQEGAVRSFSYEFPVPENCGVQLIEISANNPIHAELTLQSVSEGVLVQGTVRAKAVGRCARCLRDITIPMQEMLAELVFYPEKKEALTVEGDEEAADFPVISDDRIDLEPILRDSLVLAMPFTPLCSPDCEGLCSECGEAWRDLPEDHEHEIRDSRFTILEELREKIIESEKVERKNK